MAEFRKLKTQVRQGLSGKDWGHCLSQLQSMEPERLVGPLFSLLLHSGEVKWRAVTALGLTVARMAYRKMEDARIVMRRLIWNLSEESGNLGWGAPETMGEILAVHEGLAREYNRILVSYITQTGKDDNFIDHLPLRRGAYWGVGRLAQVRPELALQAVEPCVQGLAHPQYAPPDLHETPDPEVRGLCAWTLGSLASTGDARLLQAIPVLRQRCRDTQTCELYRDRELLQTPVAQLAREALEKLEKT